MSMWSLATVPGISSDLRQRLEQSGVYTCHDFYAKSTVDLVENSDLPYETVKYVRARLASALSATSTSVAALVGQSGVGCARLPTGLPSLDEALQGGFQCGSLTEIVGAAGLGKSQFCLAAVARCCCENRSSCAGAGASERPAPKILYLDAERKFSPSRVVEMARAFEVPVDVTPALDRVLVVRPNDCAELLSVLHAADPETTPLSLIVVDSVAQLVRGAPTNAVARASSLAAIAARIKALGTAAGCPVLVVNQVGAADRGDGTELGAALGVLWAHAVDVRLVLHQFPDGARYVQIAKSASAPVSAAGYRITAAGPVERRDAPVPDRLLDASLAMQDGTTAVVQAGAYLAPSHA